MHLVRKPSGTIVLRDEELIVDTFDSEEAAVVGITDMMHWHRRTVQELLSKASDHQEEAEELEGLLKELGVDPDG